MTLPDKLSNQDELELHEIYLQLWRENNDRFSSLTAPARWFIVFKEWSERKAARANTRLT